MDSCSVRKTLAFARTPETRNARGSWAMCVYNWSRPHRSLRRPLAEPQGSRACSIPQPWLLGSARSFGVLQICFSAPPFSSVVEIISPNHLSGSAVSKRKIKPLVLNLARKEGQGAPILCLMSESAAGDTEGSRAGSSSASQLRLLIVRSVTAP